MTLPAFGPYGVRYRSGTAASNVTVRIESAPGVLAELFEDAEGATPAANPIQTDDLGNLFFHAVSGSYEMVMGTERIPFFVPPLGGGGGAIYTHVEPDPTATWLVTHNLGQYREPLVFLDSAPTVPVYTDLVFTDANHMTIIFPDPVSGRAEFA